MAIYTQSERAIIYARWLPLEANFYEKALFVKADLAAALQCER
jgi:hypothetical protein